MEAYIAAVGADLVDSPDRRSRANNDLFAEAGDARLIGWLRCELSGPRHGLFVTLTWRSKALYLLDGVLAGKRDRIARVKDRDQVIGDRGGDEPAKGLSELAIVGLVPAIQLSGEVATNSTYSMWPLCSPSLRKWCVTVMRYPMAERLALKEMTERHGLNKYVRRSLGNG